jgi:hypothetical protein
MVVTSLVSLVLVASGPVNAAEDIYGGIKGGVNIANQSFDPDDTETDSRMGMALGGYVGIPVNQSFAVQPEALFTTKGSENESSSWKLNYIEVPVLARASFMHNASARPSLYAGPSVGINVSSKAETDISGTTEEFDVKDETNPVDFGMVVGGGLDIPISQGKNSIGLDLRYTLGLNNVSDVEGSTAEVKNGVFQIMGTVGLF